MTPIPVSTVLLTKNSAAVLPKYFASMRDIDDIIVLDGGSTDGTLALCRAQHNCRVFPQNPAYLNAQGYIIDFSGMRNEGYTHARHPWILCVDADEAATPELLAETRRIVSDGLPGVYTARRVFYVEGRRVVGLRKSSTDQIRLFHRDAVRGCVRPVHERLVIVSGAHRGEMDVEISVPLFPRKDMRVKYDRYLKIEAASLRDISVGRWLRWILLRNVIAVVRRSLVVIAVRLIPKPGPRYPLTLEWEQIRYSWTLIWMTNPFMRARRP